MNKTLLLLAALALTNLNGCADREDAQRFAHPGETCQEPEVSIFTLCPQGFTGYTATCGNREISMCCQPLYGCYAR